MEDKMILTWTDIKNETDAYLERFADELDDRMNYVDCPMTAKDIIHHAFMLTQYQRREEGIYEVNYDDFARYVQREVMEDPSIAQINLHLEADCRDEDMFYENEPDVLNEQLLGDEPWDIADKVHFGDWNPSAPYFNFDGYGNLKAWEEHDIIDLYRTETNKYLFETSFYDWSDNKDELEALDLCSELIIEYCNKMLRDGF